MDVRRMLEREIDGKQVGRRAIWRASALSEVRHDANGRAAAWKNSGQRRAICCIRLLLPEPPLG